MSEHIIQFDSWDELIHRARLGGSELTDGQRASRRTNATAKEATGVESFQEAVGLLVGGWVEGRDRVKDIASRISSVIAPLMLKPDATFSESGDEVDVPRFISGEPEHFIEYTMRQTKGFGRIAAIGLNIALASYTPRSVFENRGGALLALIDALESSGVRCELYLSHAVEAEKKSHHEWVVKAKHADQPYEVDRLAFAFIHPAMTRRIGWSIRETIKGAKGFGFCEGGGYGGPVNSRAMVDAEFKFERIRNPSDATPWESVESSTTEILRLCKQSGLIELTE
jgi:hypothetical protein